MTGTHTVEKFATFNSRERTLTYWVRRGEGHDIVTAKGCDTLAEAREMLAALIGEEFAVPQSLIGG